MRSVSCPLRRSELLTPAAAVLFPFRSMRLALARALFVKPDLLMLDEPSNMLGAFRPRPPCSSGRTRADPPPSPRMQISTPCVRLSAVRAFPTPPADRCQLRPNRSHGSRTTCKAGRPPSSSCAYRLRALCPRAR